MRDRVIRIIWSDPIPIQEAIMSAETSYEGLYYITRLYGEKKRVYTLANLVGQ